jgi:ABC-type enterochelin transport system substrate-binding protein
MKKYTLLFAVSAVLALTACGSGSAAKETKDSTVVKTDTSATVADSTTTAPTTGGEVKLAQPQK